LPNGTETRGSAKVKSQIERLTDWYQAQCNGKWEHSFGVAVGTLDNPGWLVKIDLAGTELEGRQFESFERGNSQASASWVVTKVEGKQYVGAGGASDLCEILELFLRWAESAK
jgi:hypothetical protein